ncbi:MAG: hypothetical protein AAF547_04360 [Actinomycetota bacterium]
MIGTGPWCLDCMDAAVPVGRIRGLPVLHGAGACYAYDGPVARAVVAAKGGGRPDVLRRLGPAIAVLAASLQPAGFDAVTWVPSSRAGRRRRGFDQSRVLAIAVGRPLGIPVGPPLRRRGQRRQVGQPRHRRLVGPVLEVRGRAPRRVLVVDDVVTTGGSLAAAGRACLAAGADTVVGVAVAWSATPEELRTGRVGARLAGRRSAAPPVRSGYDHGPPESWRFLDGHHRQRPSYDGLGVTSQAGGGEDRAA